MNTAQVAQLRRSRAAYPTLMINTQGAMVLNHAAFAALGQPARLLLLYDLDARLICLQPAGATDERAYRLTKQAHARSYVVSVRALLTHIGYPRAGTRAFTPTIEGQNLIIDWSLRP